MLDLSQNWDMLPGRDNLRSKRKARVMSEPPPPDLQVRWDIPEKVVVRAAVSGRSAREATATGSNFALDIESFARQAVEAIEAGSAGIHLDVGGIVTTRGQERRPSVQSHYEKIVSFICSRTQRDWVPDVNILHGETFKDNLMPVTSGLGETTMMAPDNPPEWMEAVARVVTDYGKRLFFAIHSAAEVELAERLVIRKGILEKPYCWCVLIGYVFDETASRIATSMPHPKAMLQELTLVVDRIREVEEDCYIEVCGAGRAAQYLCNLAMLMGLHVRMGTEDTVWRYPHKDELLSSAAENVKRTKTIAEQLGRTLATAEDFRKILRIKSP